MADPYDQRKGVDVAATNKQAVVDAVRDRDPKTFAEEFGIRRYRSSHCR
jgi:hypothetical protein